MKIVESQLFKAKLKEIALNIKKDKTSASVGFVVALKQSIKELVNFPYKYRKSIYYDNDNIRDMIFRDYTIVYEVFDDKIEILTILTKISHQK